MNQKKQTIYYETARQGLVPVQFLGWTETPLGLDYNATVKARRTKAGIECGEVLRVPAWSIVTKAGFRGYFQMVKPALLPARTAENTLPKPDYFNRG